jgi:hypothetical protein
MAGADRAQAVHEQRSAASERKIVEIHGLCNRQAIEEVGAWEKSRLCGLAAVITTIPVSMGASDAPCRRSFPFRFCEMNQ